MAAIDIIDAMMITSTDVTFIIEEISSNVIFQRIGDRWLLNTSCLLPAWTRRKRNYILFYFSLLTQDEFVSLHQIIDQKPTAYT